jgi:hypothetical protein
MTPDKMNGEPMNCGEFEILLCDYVDGTLDAAGKQSFEAHVRDCAGCAEFARDVTGAVAFMERAEDVIPPPELLSKIAFHIPESAGKIGSASGAGSWLTTWLRPVLQPRFAMGFAMTILSFSMLVRFAGFEDKPLKPADLNPMKIWAAADDRVHRSWQRALKYYESLRVVYEVQSRFKEWTEPEEEVPAAAAVSKPAEGQSKK